jgi:hypothetical protein
MITQFVLLVVITLSSGHYNKEVNRFTTDAACQKERAKEWKKFEAKELKELLASGEEFGVEVECFLKHLHKPGNPA